MPNHVTSRPKGPLVAVLAYDGLCTFEFGIAYEVFGLPRPEMGSRLVSLRRLRRSSRARSARRAASSCRGDRGSSVLRRADLIVVPGWRGIDAPVPPILDRALCAKRMRAARASCRCARALRFLPRAGLLDGRRATTHWRYAHSIAARYPGIRLEPDVLYVDEGDVLTAAGSAAGIDLCLHVVRKRFRPGGREQRRTPARRAAAPRGRPGAIHSSAGVAEREECPPRAR